jgi:hypothetical protein
MCQGEPQQVGIGEQDADAIGEQALGVSIG